MVQLYVLFSAVFDPTEFIDSICQLYSTRERWIAPFPWLEKFRLSLDNNFTRLKVVRRKKERGTKTNETLTVNDIFKAHEECAHPRTVLIEGKPGIGKTTFCNKLAYDWATKKKGEENPSGSFTPNFPLLLLLKCREIGSYLYREGQLCPRSRKEQLEEIFNSVLLNAIDDQLLPQDVTKEDKDEFFKFICHNQPGILMVLDGLDELPTNFLPAFKEVIQGRILQKCRIVATARQEVGMELRECCDSLLEIEGFTKDDAREFIVKYFKEDAHLAEKLLIKLELDKNLRELTESPLNSVLLCLLCEDFDGIFPESATQLYLEMIECVLRRYTKKKGLALPKAKGEDLTKVYETQLKQLGSIALKGLLQNNMSFVESEFENCAVELPEFGFLSVECGRSKLRPSLNYCFLHKTFQELFAAFYLCGQVLNNEICPENIITDTRYFRELHQILLFTCGLLASQSQEKVKPLIASIADQVNNSDLLFFALQCIGECRNDASSSFRVLLSRSLGKNLKMAELNLSDDFLGIIECSALAEVIKHNSSITVLQISCKELVTGDCNALAEAIRLNSTITLLDLSDNSLGTDDCTALAAAIKDNPAITQLNLLGNGLGTGYCTVMAEAIKDNSTITQLDLSDNQLGTGDCSALAEAIMLNWTITRLNLSWNELGTGDCTVLAAAIKLNSTIPQLNLSGNGLGTGDCTPLAEAIKDNSTITQLDLSDNRLGTGDCTVLAEAIKLNSTITRLNLSWNELGTGDCTALAAAIKDNSTIIQLDLSDNRLGTGDCTALAEAIGYHLTLTQLNLSGNGLNTDDYSPLAEAIAYNSLITVDFYKRWFLFW